MNITGHLCYAEYDDENPAVHCWCDIGHSHDHAEDQVGHGAPPPPDEHRPTPLNTQSNPKENES